MTRRRQVLIRQESHHSLAGLGKPSGSVVGLLILLMLSAAACSGTKPNAKVSVRPSPSPTLRAFDVTELKDLTLQESNPPAGLRFSADSSGPRNAEESFGKEKAEKLQELGFTQAVYASFLLDGKTPSPTGAFYLWTVAVGFPTAVEAAAASVYIRDNPSPSLKNFRLTDAAAQLGPRAWSFDADREGEDTVPEIGFCFIVSNVVILVQAEGNRPSGQEGGLSREQIAAIASTLKQNAESKL